MAHSDASATDPESVKPTISKRKPKRVFAIPRVSFRRLVQEIVDGQKSDMRLQQQAVDALQESAENLLTEHFVQCSRLVGLCKLDTVRDEHWRFVRGERVPCSGMS
jgi:histone H3/H4